MDVPKPGVHENPRVTYRGFIVRGFGSEESARLTASLYGLPVFSGETPITWKISEICHIIFLAYVAGKGGTTDDSYVAPAPEAI